MEVMFRNFENTDYDKICDFLIDLSNDDRTHINWNWARWEWMFFHPDFDSNFMDKIGLWFCYDELVGMATYDHYFGEAFFATKQGFEALKEDILQYALANFSTEKGLGIAVNDSDTRTLDLLHRWKFKKNDLTENILEITLEQGNLDSIPPNGITIKNLDIKNDLYKHQTVLWEGFNNEGPVPTDEVTIMKQKVMLSAPHLNPTLHIAAQNDDGDYVAYCGLWYSAKTDYAYVEPVCTLPEYRSKGIAKAMLSESLNRCYAMGAKRAYVISNDSFYKSLGFQQHSHYTFYWHNE
ncbi:Acetyltransferase (GNAT) family protein [compost metagenome]